MKKLIQILIVCGIFVFMGGTASGDDFQDGMDAYKRKDFKEAVRLFRLSAEQGNPRAQYNLGYMYQRAQGVPEDFKEAIKWFRLSVEQLEKQGKHKERMENMKEHIKHMQEVIANRAVDEKKKAEETANAFE